VQSAMNGRVLRNRTSPRGSVSEGGSADEKRGVTMAKERGGISKKGRRLLFNAGENHHVGGGGCGGGWGGGFIVGGKSILNFWKGKAASG